MAKQMWLDPNTGVPTDQPQDPKYEIDPNTGSLKSGEGGGFALPGDVHLTAQAHKLSDAFGVGVGNAGSVGEQLGGKSSSSGSGGGTGSSATYDPANMIRTYLPGLNPEQTQAVRQALKGSESGSGTDYHNALNQLTQQYPQLQQYTPMGRAFPPPGQLNAQVMQGLTDWTNAYEKPLTEAMQADTSQVMGALKGIKGLPPSFQNLVNSQGPQMQSMAGEISNLLKQAQPGAIANAYAQAYGTPAATTGTGLNLNNLVPPTAPKTA